MSPKGAAGIGLALLAAVLVTHFGLLAVLPGHEEGEHDHESDHDHEEAGAGTVAAPAPDASASAAADPEALESPAPEESAAAEEAAAGPPPAWTIQPGGSLTFVADNGGTALNGSFRRWDGTIAMDPAHPESAEIAIRIDLASATLGDSSQDEMLAGADFFNVAVHPSATFRSSDVTSTGANAYRARGTLSLHGASRPQTINFTLSGSGARRQVSGSATVDRNAFGVGTGDSASGVAGAVRVAFAFHAAS